jgi:hypothetical protein
MKRWLKRAYRHHAQSRELKLSRHLSRDAFWVQGSLFRVQRSVQGSGFGSGFRVQGSVQGSAFGLAFNVQGSGFVSLCTEPGNLAPRPLNVEPLDLLNHSSWSGRLRHEHAIDEPFELLGTLGEQPVARAVGIAASEQLIGDVEGRKYSESN